MKALRRSVTILVIVGESISTGGFLYSLLGYFVHRSNVEAVIAFAPLERDYVSEVVAPLVSGQPKGESALNLVRLRLEESRILHKGWLELAQSTLNTERIECFMWGGVLLVFLALDIAVRRTRQVPDPAL